MPDRVHALFRHVRSTFPKHSGLWVYLDMARVDPPDSPVAGMGNGFVGIAETQVGGKKTVGDQFAVARTRDHYVRLKTAIALTRRRTIKQISAM